MIATNQDNFNIEYKNVPDESQTFVMSTSIDTDDGRHLFRYIGILLTYITPHELTVVNCILELLKDVLQFKVSIGQLIVEALKIESGFICLIAILLFVAIIPFCALAIWLCFGGSKAKQLNISQNFSSYDDDLQTGAILGIDDNIDSTIYCRRILQFLLQLFTGCMIGSIAIMFVTNELVRTAITNTPNIVHSSLKDIESFSKDAQKDIIGTINDGMSIATERIKYDIENIDKLLGEPIQKKIETDSGLKTTLESVLGICSGNYEIIHRVQLLQDAVGKAILISKEATQRIEEFQAQLSNLQRQCSARDRPLCDILRLRSFDDNGLLNTLTKMHSDPNLLRMLNLGEIHLNNQQMNISTEMKAIQNKLHNFPINVRMNMTQMSQNIEHFLTVMQTSIQSGTQRLTETMNEFVTEVESILQNIEPLMQQLQITGYVTWKITLFTSISVLGITLVLSIALLLGIIHAERAAKVTFVCGAILITLGSCGLAIFAIIILLAGSHGEVFLCRPMYDTPNYLIFSKLFDKPGWAYENETINGFVNDLLYTTNVEETKSLNITLANALDQCERNEATYDVFQFNRLANVSQMLGIHEYSQLDEEIEKIFVSSSSFATLTDTLQSILTYMYTNSEINFQTYRNDLNRPSPEKDLSTFIDQMQRVSVQIQDSTTSSRMSTLGNRARRLQATIMQPLERLRSEIQFELTALQLQKEPWTDMVNQSLSHLKTTQYFIDQDSADICYNKSLSYKLRLKEHLLMNKRETLRQLKNSIAPCRPLYNIFDVNRHLFCHHIVDPLNGLWFSSFVSLMIWAILTPIALGLATVYTNMSNSRGLIRSSSHQVPADSMIISEQSNWGSRPIQTPPMARRTPPMPRSSPPPMPNRPAQRQSVRSSRSEMANFTFDEDTNNNDNNNERPNQRVRMQQH